MKLGLFRRTFPLLFLLFAPQIHAQTQRQASDNRESTASISGRVTIDGKPPGDSHGADTDADGQGVVNGQRLYQLIRQNGAITDRTFEIRFLDPGAEAYAFTFG